MKESLVKIAFGFVLGVGVGYLMLVFGQRHELLNPGKIIPNASVELSYEKLAFERLAKREVVFGKIEVGGKIGEGEGHESYKFFYTSEGKRISGQLNLPLGVESQKIPVVVMARGYVPKEDYQMGVGTRTAAAVYAKNGYITLAPDFLGYGESDMEDTDSIGARLYRPVEILDLLAALPSLPQVDTNEVFLWGHSNGGQIMLSVAEVGGMSDCQSVGASGSQCVGESVNANFSLRGQTPQVRGMMLWAPVSKPFPYSILAFSDEAEDQGKALRKVVSIFETQYDVFNYSIDRYFDKIEIPVIVHQGTDDDAVPYYWSDELVEKLRELKKDITYYKYPGADHNLKPGWDTVVARDLIFMDDLR